MSNAFNAWGRVQSGDMLLYKASWTSTDCNLLGICNQYTILTLKTLDAIGNCQRLVFTVGVPQHMHQITNL